MTRGHSKKIKKKNQKNLKKPRSDTWHTPGLTRVHLKTILKINLKNIKNKIKNKKIQKNHEVTRDSHCSMDIIDLNGVSKKGPN